MREEYQAELADVTRTLVAMAEGVRTAMRRASAALIAGKVAEVLESADAARAAELERDDDEMDELLRQLYGLMLGTAWRHGVEPAVDGALLGRWYERFADHAVNAGRSVLYFVTGEAAPAAS